MRQTTRTFWISLLKNFLLLTYSVIRTIDYYLNFLLLLLLFQERLFWTCSNTHWREAVSMSRLSKMFQSTEPPQTSRRRRPQELGRKYWRFKRRRKSTGGKHIARANNKSGGHVPFRQLAGPGIFCRFVSPYVRTHSSSGKLDRALVLFAVHRDLLEARRRRSFRRNLILCP